MAVARVVVGSSWGSTLLLAYAERFTERVSEIVITSVTMTRQTEIDWLYRGLAPFFPTEWQRFHAGVLPADPDPGVRMRAAGGLARLGRRHRLPGAARQTQFLQRPAPGALRARARICTHYFSHATWLAEGNRCTRAHLAIRRRDDPALIPRNRLHEAHRTGTGHDAGQSEPGLVKQDAELGLGAVPTTRAHDHHLHIHEFCCRRRCTFG